MTDCPVVIVEDDCATRERVGAAIVAQPGLTLQAAVGSCREARQILRDACPRVLLVDLGLPDGDGTDIVREAAAMAAVDIMVLTMFGDERHVVGALEAGATGYLLKDGSDENIGDAVLRLIQGGSPISPKIARFLVRRMQAPRVTKSTEQTNLVLTEREQQVLEHIAKGFSYAETANLLNISCQTVPSHIKRIYRKLAVRSRSEAVFEAAHMGLIRLHG